MWTSASVHDEVTGTKKKKGKLNIWNNGFQDTKHQGTKYSDPEKRETNEVSPTIVPTHCLESFEVMVQGEGIQA